MLGVGVLVVISPLLASVAIQFGAYEYCALSVFSLSMVIALSGRDLTKGLISAVLGAIWATVGLAPIDSRARYTFGFIELTAGFKLLVFLIGIFAITEVIRFAEEVRSDIHYDIREDVKVRGFGFSFREFRGQFVNMIRSALIGIGIGILPGIGAESPACSPTPPPRTVPGTPKSSGRAFSTVWWRPKPPTTRP